MADQFLAVLSILNMFVGFRKEAFTSNPAINAAKNTAHKPKQSGNKTIKNH